MPDRPRPSAARRAATWLRYHGWTLLVHLLLIVFGVLNLYPFMWMLGTSLKAEVEASAERQNPIPVVKYRLSARGKRPRRCDLTTKQLQLLARLQKQAKRFADLRERVEKDPDRSAELLASFRKEFGDLARERPPARDPADELHKLLDRLEKRALTVTPEQHSRASGQDLAAAEKDLHRLAEAQMIAAGDGGTYTLTDRGRGEVADGLNPRQLLMLRSLRAENQRRRESRVTFAEDRWSQAAYAKNFGVPPATARRDIRGMVERGLLLAGRIQPVNYWIVLKEENFILHFLTSLIITVAVVFLTVMITSMLGYALARMRFPGKMVVLALMLAGAVAPREAVIIPIFRLLKSIGALDGLWGMVLWLTGVGLGNAFLMAGFFLTLPQEVEEAAAVDGAGPFRTFFDVALPMARPIVMTVALFAFLTAWNNFLIPLLCTVSRPSMQPLAVAVYNFQRGHPGKWHQINAAAAIMIIPVILLFLFLQRHVVRSIAVGAVKG